MLEVATRWLLGAPLRARSGTRLDVLLAGLLSTLGVLLVSGSVDSTDPRGGVLACTLVLLMTAPVAWRSVAPLRASAVVGVGAVLNAVVAGDFVRCGAALPALALVTYSVGVRCPRRESIIGAGFAVTSAVAQGLSDPQLKHGFFPGGCAIVLALWWVGCMVRSRDGVAAALRAWTAELERQRDRTARLAVSADRVQIADELHGFLKERMRDVAAEAAVAREAIHNHPAEAAASLTAIERDGRRTLSDMREIVGSLRSEQPVSPQPSLDDLDRLLCQAVSSSARVFVEGESCKLPAGLELSAFRIVERLIEPLENGAGARVRVTLHYAPDTLALAVQGQVRSGADLSAPLAAAREWASLYAGRIESRSQSGIAHTDVRLPLVSSHA